METPIYLLHLSIRLAEGLERLPDEFCARHRAYLRAACNMDGGFSGREGGSDLYYTGFGLRGLAILDDLTPETCRHVGEYLRRSLTQKAGIVDFFSLLYACFLVQLGGTDVLAASPPDWPELVAAVLETFRTPDGGYAKVQGGVSGSVYHTFLVGLCYQLLDKAWPHADGVRAFIQSRHRLDGGYVEIAPMQRSGTNPTAAAVGVLQLLGDVGSQSAPHDPAHQKTIEFLVAMTSPEGGLRGNGRVPAADLLSTFTGAWTLSELGALDRIDRAAMLRYTRALELPDGGFRGGLWDTCADVEYTFYGLGTVALLAPAP